MAVRESMIDLVEMLVACFDAVLADLVFWTEVDLVKQ